jgi:hypothetical protein
LGLPLLGLKLGPVFGLPVLETEAEAAPLLGLPALLELPMLGLVSGLGLGLKLGPVFGLPTLETEDRPPVYQNDFVLGLPGLWPELEKHC